MLKIIPVIYKSQRVLTTAQLAEVYETETNNIANNFARNKDRFKEGVHYYFLKGADLQGLKNYITDSEIVPRNAPHFYLWTEQGASRHCKILDTDKAWERFDELENTYFKIKETAFQLQQLSPELQLFNQMFIALARNELLLKETKQIATDAKAEAVAAKESLTEIKNTIAELPKDQWRKWINSSISEIVKSEKCKLTFEGVWNESYRLLEEKSKSDLTTRVRNKRKRLANAGATKTAIDSFCKLDAIEEDKYLKEIYTNIIQKMRIKYIV
jgi:hypothetical protein